MTTKYIERQGYQNTEVTVYETRMPTDVGKFAAHLAQHFSIVAAQPDGEDTSGRQRLTLMHPADVAKRACDVAQAMWRELADRGWFLDLPDLKPKPPGGWPMDQPMQIQPNKKT